MFVRKENDMNSGLTFRKPILTAIVISNMFFAGRAFAADIKGQVLGGGVPIAQSSVTLMEAGTGTQTARTGQDRE